MYIECNFITIEWGINNGMDYSCMRCRHGGLMEIVIRVEHFCSNTPYIFEFTEKRLDNE